MTTNRIVQSPDITTHKVRATNGGADSVGRSAVDAEQHMYCLTAGTHWPIKYDIDSLVCISESNPCKLKSGKLVIGVFN